MLRSVVMQQRTAVCQNQFLLSGLIKCYVFNLNQIYGIPCYDITTPCFIESSGAALGSKPRLVISDKQIPEVTNKSEETYFGRNPK